ncbi:MAG: glycosyltransferase family 39 protein [Saprospiraceae bacterium]
MVFFKYETLAALVGVSLPAIAASYFYFYRNKRQAGMALLLLSAFLLRILMISLDPYLHEWDERFHALVAKHMMDMPFRPTLFAKQILPFNPYDWSYTHIWVHKQPLFLWQMAISMKIFGINTFALRLPSAVLGTIMVWLTYDISRKWINDVQVAFITAFLSGFAHYTLELTSGVISLDHNDLAFVFYVTCCFWAFTRYVHSDFKMKWALLVGLFAGFAILNKWLVGLLIFGGWGVYLLSSEFRYDLHKYIHFGAAVVVTCIVFIPWQIYIHHAFPVESAIAFEDNKRHISEDLGHPGNAWSHIAFLPNAYNYVLLIFFGIGLVLVLKSKIANRNISVAFLSMIAVIFLFFSLFVATKMPAFVYPVSALVLIISACGFYKSLEFIFNHLKLALDVRKWMFCILTLGLSYISLKPLEIIQARDISNQERNNKIYNTSIYKRLDKEAIKDHVIINCRAYENIDLMFYNDVLALHFYPPENIVDSLQEAGYKLAAFDYIHDKQQLPEYITCDKEILVIKESLK